MDIPRNYHLEDKVEYIIALVNEERMIRLSGVKGIEIRFTGLRDGEKLYEEVLNFVFQMIVTRYIHNDYFTENKNNHLSS